MDDLEGPWPAVANRPGSALHEGRQLADGASTGWAGILSILLVSDETNFGGAELAFLELAKALALHVPVDLAIDARNLRYRAYSSITTPNTRLRIHPCRHRLYPGTGATYLPLLRRSASAELAQLVSSRGPDLILVNLPTVERGQAALDAVELTEPKPAIWGYLHLAQSPSTLGVKFGPLRNILAGRLLRRFDRLLTVCRSNVRKLVNEYAAPPAEILHPPTPALQPISSLETRSTARKSAGLPEGWLVGLIGRVQLQHKGFDTALRVLAGVKPQIPDLYVVVIGDGPDLHSLQGLSAKLGASAYVTFLGWRDDIDRLIPLLDLVLMPSHFEGVPQTAIQSATAGIPVLAYAVDGLPELLPESFLVPHGDEESLAERVKEVRQGTRPWPKREMAERAVAWGSPAAAAEHLMMLMSESRRTDPASPQDESPLGKGRDSL